MIKLLIETNVEVNLRSIEEFTRVMASELLEDKILFDIQREENLIKIKVSSENFSWTYSHKRTPSIIFI